MEIDEATTDVMVVGGGLAGLAAATTAARQGRRVTLLEARSEAGGRARTTTQDDFLLNEGPHALYLQGEGGPQRCVNDPGPAWPLPRAQRVPRQSNLYSL